MGVVGACARLRLGCLARRPSGRVRCGCFVTAGATQRSDRHLHFPGYAMSQRLHDLPFRGAADWPTLTLRPDAVPRRVVESADPIQVTLVGGDVGQRRRLAELLAHVAGIEVTGWSDSPRALAVLDSCAALDVVLSVPVQPVEMRRPQLSPRQREVLVAYSAGNDLLDVVARGLGMKAETFKTHLSRIRIKYDEVGRPAPTRRDLYVRAVQDGLLPPPS